MIYFSYKKYGFFSKTSRGAIRRATVIFWLLPLQIKRVHFNFPNVKATSHLCLNTHSEYLSIQVKYIECYSIRGSHFFGLTKFHDISMIFPGFLVNFQVFFSLFLKYDFQVVWNINMQT